MVERWDGLESVQAKKVWIEVEPNYALHAFVANELNLAIAFSTWRWELTLIVAEELNNLIASLSISGATMRAIIVIDKIF